MTSRAASRGLTLVEVTVAVAIMSVVLLVAGSLAVSAQDEAAGAFTRTGEAVRAGEVADRLVRELQTAGFSGEDENGSGALDAGEDLDRDGRLDADWSLADAASASDLTFNFVQRGWMWSDPITWRLAGDVLERVENGHAVAMTRHVQEFTVTRTGERVDVRLVLAGTDLRGRPWSDRAERRVHVRN